MPTTNPPLNVAALAKLCANTLSVVTPALASRALSLPLSAAKNELQAASKAGLFRAAFHPTTRAILYQPTPRASGVSATIAPRALRSNAPPSALLRGLLRGQVILQSATGKWLSWREADEFCIANGIAIRGYAPALFARQEDGFLHIFETTLNTEQPDALIFRVMKRWLPLADSRINFNVSFIAQDTHGELQHALNEMFPAAEAEVELRKIEAQIATDPSTRITLTARKLKLEEAISASFLLPWLNTNVNKVGA